MPNKDPDKRKQYHRHYNRENYQRNCESFKAQVAARKQVLRNWVWQIKCKLSCAICGESHPAVLDFHHTDPSAKTISVYKAVARGWGQDRILAEIEKCEVLCSNCHRKAHYQPDKE